MPFDSHSPLQPNIRKHEWTPVMLDHPLNVCIQFHGHSSTHPGVQMGPNYILVVTAWPKFTRTASQFETAKIFAPIIFAILINAETATATTVSK